MRVDFLAALATLIGKNKTKNLIHNQTSYLTGVSLDSLLIFGLGAPGLAVVGLAMFRLL